MPDANFKANLLAANGTTFTIAASGTYPSFSHRAIDSNHDGEIQYSEAEAITYLLVMSSNIADLTGIEAFINLTSLECSYNSLAAVNLTQLTHLEHFNCYQNHITSLDLSNLPNLKMIFCAGNLISTLDFSNNPLLEKVFCYNNQISSLDFSNNPLFNELDCKNNLDLSSIKIKNGAMQLFGAQTYYNLCWTGTSLNTICADANEINALQTFLLNCGINTNNINISSNCALSTENYKNTTEDIRFFSNAGTGFYTIHIKNDAKLEIYDFLGKKMLRQEVFNNLDNIIDLSFCANGIYFAKISSTNNEIKIIKLIKE